MENRTEMLRRVTRLAKAEPEEAARRLGRLEHELPADMALARPLLRAFGFRDRHEIDAERRALAALCTKGRIV